MSKARRVASKVYRKFRPPAPDPAVVLRERMAAGTASKTERAAVRGLMQDQLAGVDPETPAWLRDSVAEAFEHLWDPQSQPVKPPARKVSRAIQIQMNRLYYHVSMRTWKDTWYRGTQLYKCPTDMWVYQEIIDTLKPGLVIETGTFRGGSAQFIADRLELNGHGEVITIDITALPDQPQHPRLTYLIASSTAEETLELVKKRLPTDGSPVLVILDSDHTQAHVADELRAYAPLVTEGSYLIVEDTNVNNHPVAPDHGPGPWEAVEEFLEETDDFEIDKRGQRYFLTQNPDGFLRKISTSGDTPTGNRPVARPTDPVHIATAGLADTTMTADAASLVLVLPGLQPGQMFAGVRTAVTVAATAAAKLDRPLRVITLDDSAVDIEALHDDLAETVRDIDGVSGVADRLTVSAHGHRVSDHHADDIWMVTFWTTALAVADLVKREVVDRSQVVYLIQDFEPGFFAWGHRYAQALSTYQLGFLPVVNSTSLAGYLEREGVADVDAARTFAPAVDTDPLRSAAEAWTPDPETIRVLFYARPSKPRNMWGTGWAALMTWVDSLPEGTKVEITLAGEDISVPPLVDAPITLRNVGKLSYEQYLEELKRTDIGLALMLSPHPSHLALELPMAGIPTVTNQFGGVREEWVDGLHVASADEAGIAAGLAQAAAAAEGLQTHTFREIGSTLGVGVDEAVEAMLAQLDRS